MGTMLLGPHSHLLYRFRRYESQFSEAALSGATSSEKDFVAETGRLAAESV